MNTSKAHRCTNSHGHACSRCCFSVTALLLGTRRAWFCTFLTEVKAQEATQPKPKPLQEVTGMSGGGLCGVGHQCEDMLDQHLSLPLWCLFCPFPCDRFTSGLCKFQISSLFQQGGPLGPQSLFPHVSIETLPSVSIVLLTLTQLTAAAALLLHLWPLSRCVCLL